MPKKKSDHQQKRVPLSPSERVQAKMLSRWAIRLAVRDEAAELLEIGAYENYLADLRVSTTTSLCGHLVAMERWGASSAEACRRAQQRVRKAGLVDGALYLAILYDVHRTAPPPIYLGCGSGLDGPPGSGLAWPCGSMVDPSIQVRRYPPKEQMEIWDGDDVPWTYWASVRSSE